MALGWRRPPYSAVFVLIGLLGAAKAGAEDVDTIIKHGVELRKKGQDREALAEFQRALAIRETPRVLAQVGLAEHALGLWLAAEEHLAAALSHPDDSWIQRNRVSLSDARSAVSSHLGIVEIWGEPAGAEVLVNGKLAGKLPSAAPTRVLAGACSVTVHADGYDEATRTLQVTPGQLVRENVQLVVRPRPRPSVASTAIAGQATKSPSGGMPSLATTGPGSPEQAEKTGGIATRWWFWTGIGVVLVGGVVAALLLTRSSGGVGCPRGVDCPP